MSDNNRYFQWIVGERRNEVMIFEEIEEDDGMVFIKFKDQSRINDELVGELGAKSLDGKMMAEVESHDNLWTFEEKMVGEEKEKWEENNAGERVCVQPAIAGRKVIKLIPPRKTRSKFGNVNTPEPSTQPRQSAPKPVETKKNLNSSDPVYIMLDKAKKVDSEVNMTLTIALPTQSLFDVVQDSFEEGGKKALEYIIDSLDIELIKKELRDGIDSMYNDKDAEETPTLQDLPDTEINELGEPIGVVAPQVSEPYIEKGGTGMPE